MASCGAILLGGTFGYTAARLFEWADRVNIVEQRGFIAYTLALTFVVLGAARLLSMDGILAMFAAEIERMGASLEQYYVYIGQFPISPHQPLYGVW